MIWGLGFRVEGLGLGLRERFRCWILGFRVWGLGWSFGLG